MDTVRWSRNILPPKVLDSLIQAEIDVVVAVLVVVVAIVVVVVVDVVVLLLLKNMH